MVRALLLLAGSAALAADSPFAFRDVDARSLALVESGKTVYVYNHGMMLKPGFPEEMSRSTYLHPVYTPDGTLITDDFNKDHPHHRGISWMWPVVEVDGKAYDIWTVKGMKQRFVRWRAREAGKTARLAAENGWYAGERKVVAENVEIVAYPAASGERRLEFTLRFEAVGEPVRIAGTPAGKKGFGGFCFRFAPRDGGKDKTVITTSRGVMKADGVMEKARWAEVSGHFDGRPERGRVEDLPGNPGYPDNGWLMRHGFGFLNPSWPGMEGYTLKPGAPLVLKYRVTLAGGAAK